MKLSDKTMQVLKNFATINQGFIITPGNVISTIAVEKYIVAYCDVDETFERECQIWNLPMFLQVLSVMDDPDIEWNEKTAQMSSGQYLFNYTYGRNVEPRAPLKSKLKKREFAATFNITADELSKIMKMGNIISAEYVTIDIDEKTQTVGLKGGETKSNTNQFSIKVAAEIDAPVSVAVALRHLSILQLDYKVSVTDSAIMLENSDFGIVYLLAPSTMEDD